MALTDAGQAAFARAEEIFQIGQGLAQEVRTAATKPVIRLSVGLSDGISKLAARARPGAGHADLRLTCHEGEFEELLGELAQHHLDLVLAGQGAPANPNLRLTSDRLVSSPVDWYGPSRLLRRADVQAFPQSLERLPVLLPTGHSVLRQTLDRWFREQGIHPNVVGEFEDSALMSVFAARGLGVFPLSRLGGDDIGLLRPAAAGPRRGPRGDPRYPQSPGTEPSLVRRILEQAKTSVFVMFVTLSLVFRNRIDSILVAFPHSGVPLS